MQESVLVMVSWAIASFGEPEFSIYPICMCAMMLWRDRVPSHPREAARGGSMRERSGWQLASGSVAEANERYIMAAFGNA